MVIRKIILWSHLDQIRLYTDISDADHAILDINIIQQKKKETRAKWHSCKKRSFDVRRKFLRERATFTEEKALRTILKAEEPRTMYRNIKDLLGKPQAIFTQVDISSDPKSPTSPHITLTSQEDIEKHILERNRQHSLQSLETPFFTDPVLFNAIYPKPDNLDLLLDGSFLDTFCDSLNLPDTQKQWIKELKQIVISEVSLQSTVEDFKAFFQAKKERTASSPSGRHMGHYRTLLECLRKEDPFIPNLIIDIAHTSLITATLLNRWQMALQIMLEKGKGHHIENLQIIQLCEAVLNFVLHVIWGHRMIQRAKHNNVLDNAQYAIPG
jgi:hypothetical protein